MGMNQIIVKVENDDTCSYEVFKDVIRHALEGTACVGDAEGHALKLE